MPVEPFPDKECYDRKGKGYEDDEDMSLVTACLSLDRSLILGIVNS